MSQGLSPELKESLWITLHHHLRQFLVHFQHEQVNC